MSALPQRVRHHRAVCAARRDEVQLSGGCHARDGVRVPEQDPARLLPEPAAAREGRVRAAPSVGRRGHFPHRDCGIPRTGDDDCRAVCPPQGIFPPSSAVVDVSRVRDVELGAERVREGTFRVALGPRAPGAARRGGHARHQVPVSGGDLQLTRVLHGEHPKAVVPVPAGEQNLTTRDRREVLRSDARVRGEGRDPALDGDGIPALHPVPGRVLVTTRVRAGDVFLDILDEIRGGPYGLRDGAARVAPRGGVDFRSDEPVHADGAVRRGGDHARTRRQSRDVCRLSEIKFVVAVHADESDGRRGVRLGRIPGRRHHGGERDGVRRVPDGRERRRGRRSPRVRFPEELRGGLAKVDNLRLRRRSRVGVLDGVEVD